MAKGDKKPVVMGEGIVNDLVTGGATAALSAEMGKVLGRRPNPNLLHNWYFKNLVNQRGQTEYASTSFDGKYTIDRWVLQYKGAKIVLESGGIAAYAANDGKWQMHQKFEAKALQPNTAYTISVVSDISGMKVQFYWNGAKQFASYEPLENGAYTFTTPATECESAVLYLYCSGTANTKLGTIAAVKLEVGDTQTLAHQENGVWVLNEIPDYGEELAKCQRYYQTVKTSIVSGVLTLTKTELRVGVPLPVSLRANPAITGCTISGVRTVNGESTNPEVQSCTLYSLSDNCATVTINVGTAYEDAKYLNNSPIGLVLESLVLSAEL